jgi:signal transduction histidine kinase
LTSDTEPTERLDRALLDAIPDYVFRIARDGTYLDFHAHQLNEVLAERDRFIGSNVRDHLPPQVAEEVLVAIERVLSTGQSATLAGEVEQNGLTHPFESRIAQSGPNEVLAIVRDVTAQQAVEQALRESRAHVVEAGYAERRRIERNLHDGAQQRLVSLLLTMRLAETQLRPDADSARALLRSLSAELTEALAELRELARGIHPAILSARGPCTPGSNAGS